jgi:hypothetical protein
VFTRQVFHSRQEHEFCSSLRPNRLCGPLALLITGSQWRFLWVYMVYSVKLTVRLYVVTRLGKPWSCRPKLTPKYLPHNFTGRWCFLKNRDNCLTALLFVGRSEVRKMSFRVSIMHIYSSLRNNEIFGRFCSSESNISFQRPNISTELSMHSSHRVYSLDGRGSIPCKGMEFSSLSPRPDQLWGTSCFPTTGYRA